MHHGPFSGAPAPQLTRPDSTSDSTVSRGPVNKPAPAAPRGSIARAPSPGKDWPPEPQWLHLEFGSDVYRTADRLQRCWRYRIGVKTVVSDPMAVSILKENVLSCSWNMFAVLGDPKVPHNLIPIFRIGLLA